MQVLSVFVRRPLVLALALSLGLIPGRVAATVPSVQLVHDFVAQWDESGRVTLSRGMGPALAINLAQNYGQPFSREHITSLDVADTPGEQRWQLVGRSAAGEFRALVRFDRQSPGLVHWSVTGRFNHPTELVAGGLDVVPYSEDGRQASRLGTAFGVPQGYQLPAILAHDPELRANLFYMVNLTALDALYGYTGGEPKNVVRAQPNGFAFATPGGTVPVGVDIPLSDAFVYIEDAASLSAADAPGAFINMLSTVYDRLPKPQTTYTDWNAVATNATADLLRRENWAEQGTRLYLQSYLADRRGSKEYIAGGDVLEPLTRLLVANDRSVADRAAMLELRRRIETGLESFWDSGFASMGSIGNNPAPMGSEWDAWYWFNGYINTLNLARTGNETARRMALGSVGKLVQVGRAFRYRFPFVMDIRSLRAVRDNFYEGDTTGAYIYLMLSYHELTGDDVYIDEARRAAEVISSFGFNLSYELHMTGITAAALSWLAQVTGEPDYLNMAAIPLVNILRASWLWENNTGWAADYTTFGGLSPISGAEMITAFEMHNTWRYLYEFYIRAERQMPTAWRKLVAELLKYQLNVGRSTLPPFLPTGALSAQPDLGRNDATAYIPVEDLRTGRFRSGTIGQEIYGAGLPFQFAAGAYRVLIDAGVRVYCEYPITDVAWNATQQTIHVHIGGVAGYLARVRLEALAQDGSVGEWVVTSADGSAMPMQATNAAIETFAPGGTELVFQQAQLSWQQTDTSARLVASGSTVRLPVRIDNPTGGLVNMALSAADTYGNSWPVQPEQVEIPAHQTVTALVSLTVPASTPAVIRQVNLVGENAQAKLSLPWLFEVVAKTDAGFTDQFNGAGNWQPYLGSPVTIEEGFGTGSFRSNAGYGVAASRELVIDVDQYPLLRLRVLKTDGQWALKVVRSGNLADGWYLQGDTTQTGTFTYDLRERLGWEGLQRFRILLIPVGNGKTVQADWVRVENTQEQ